MKKVMKCWYSHVSDLTNMSLSIDSFEDNDLLSWAISWMYFHRTEWAVCKYDTEKHTISLIQCPTWDEMYEPIVGDSYVFKERNTAPRVVQGSKTVYHRKHEFVSEDYDGFDIEASKQRTKLIESYQWVKENKSRMGSLRIWLEFIERLDLPVNMPIRI